MDDYCQVIVGLLLVILIASCFNDDDYTNWF